MFDFLFKRRSGAVSRPKNLAGPHYKIVQGPDVFQRDQGMQETMGEDFYLNAFRRGRLLDLTRNAARNSATFNSILKSFDLHAIGTNGGKVILDLKDYDQALRIRDKFAEWTRNSDFFDGLSLNSTLRLILKTYLIGGDTVLLYDDGLVEDSGKLLVYEPDEIANTSETALKARYGGFARQSLGRVYNGNGRWIGAIVSRSQRGMPEFDPSKSYLLKRDPDSSYFDNLWLMPRNVFRPAQGRGVSPASSVLASVLDLEDLLKFELAAAKKNSQVVGTIVEESHDDTAAPSAFDGEVDFDGMTDEEIKAYAEAEAQAEKTVSLDVIKNYGAIYQTLPAGFKWEQIDTKHPNANMPDFIKFMAGRSASAFGLSQNFADFQVNGSDYEANMAFSKRTFEDAQKFLEGVCDWLFYRWAKWEAKHGNDMGITPEIVTQSVSWEWPHANELDENAHAQADALKLNNMTSSYKEILGNNWKEKLEQIKEEVNWFKENNLPHPSFNQISGGERTGVDKMSDGTEV